jgi:hypothetical protein
MKSLIFLLIYPVLFSAAVASGKSQGPLSLSTPPPSYTIIQAKTSAANLRGIHVGGNDVVQTQKKSLAAALSVPGVDGLLLVIGWNEIEPAMGQYQWDTLDLWIGRADSSGKDVTLSVRAGINTPSWLFQPAQRGAGATRLSFSVTRKGGGASSVCEPDSIAAPWDPAFLAQWDSMLVELAAHLKSVGTYGRVTLIRLTGINRDTDELHLPAETSQSTGLACVSDAITIWQQAGYRPSLLLQGWDAITSSFKKSFPDKCFSVAIIAITNPFPPIAEDGSIFTITSHESLSVSQNLPLLTLASQKFPGHLVIQNNTLYLTEQAQPQTIHAAQSLGTMIAFQTNEDITSSDGKQAACGARGDTTACTELTFLKLLETGIYPLGKNDSLRAQYIEVFAANVNDFPQDIMEAHLELLASNQTNVHQPEPTLPSAFDLQQNYPNPFNPLTVVSYQLPVASNVRLVVYDVLGREVAVLVNERKAPGTYAVTFDGSGLASGVYFYRLSAGDFLQMKKLVLLR